MINRRFLVVTAFMLISCGRMPHVPEGLRTGDIIFHTSKSAQSQAIQLATGSRYSHMGLIVIDNGQPYVIEAIQPVSRTPLEKWIARGEGGHFLIKRLTNADSMLTPEATRKLIAEADRFLGKQYDAQFDWSDDRIYCSELVWKAFDRALHVHLGELRKLSDFNLSHPIVAAKLRERYGANIPLDERVIAPTDIFESKLLITVVDE